MGLYNMWVFISFSLFGVVCFLGGTVCGYAASEHEHAKENK